MAKPIKETPILTGTDAEHFEYSVEHPRAVTREEVERALAVYERLSKCSELVQAYLPGDDKASWNRLNRKINNHKRLKSYPAVKIGRLGTQRDFAGQGIGREILDYIKLLFVRSNKTGCRFLTVDAHKDAIGFYLKCGFSFFTENDRDDETRLMYFDLKPFADMVRAGK